LRVTETSGSETDNPTCCNLRNGALQLTLQEHQKLEGIPPTGGTK